MQRPFRIPIQVLLAFNGGFVDTAGFLGLHGLFTSHVTGNFVTLGASIVLGTSGVVTKLLALPVFVIAVGLARVAGNYLAGRGKSALSWLLIAKTVLLFAFFVLAVTLGPFPDGDAPSAMLTGLVGVAGMAIQNAVQRIHLTGEPPTTIMTGTTTEIAIDAVDLLTGREPDNADKLRRRFGRLVRAVASFAAGSVVAASAYYFVGFWCLAIAVVVATLASIDRWMNREPDPGPSAA